MSAAYHTCLRPWVAAMMHVHRSKHKIVCAACMHVNSIWGFFPFPGHSPVTLTGREHPLKKGACILIVHQAI